MPCLWAPQLQPFINQNKIGATPHTTTHNSTRGSYPLRVSTLESCIPYRANEILKCKPFHMEEKMPVLKEQ